MKLCFPSLILSLLFLSASTVAAPYTPGNDALVLEHLPFKASDPTTMEIRQLRDELASDPQNLGKATLLAKRYFQLAMADGDPRFVGYAQAALSFWWAMEEPPVPVLIMRASLRQYNHDFVTAMTDLDQALRREPLNGPAWSLRAAIHLVQAKYDIARKDCANLHGITSELIVLACTATADSLSGQGQQAYTALRKTYMATTDASPEERLWVVTRLAEMADRLGLSRDADTYFRLALKLNLPDAYLLAVYADFLLDEQRYHEVITLLKGKERSDVLLMRLALAEKNLGSAQAKQHEQVIRARFDAARLRGDKLHIQDEARFYLYFLGNPQEALRLAQENWKTQHEPSDARMLLEAALANKNATAAKPALEMLTQTHLEDRHLQRLAEQITQPGAKP